VLQRGHPIKVWGFDAPAGERLAVMLGPTEDSPTVSVEVRANSGGDWAATLRTPPLAATGTSLRLSLRRVGASEPTEVLEDVVLGDVYLFSGQSNADLPEAYAFQFDPQAQAREERAADELGHSGLVRLMTIPARCGLSFGDTINAKELPSVPDCLPCPSPFGRQQPVNKCNAMGGASFGPFNYSYCGCDALRWTRATGPLVRGFSAVAWFTGRALASWEGLRGVPIGLVRSSWGATSIASWSSLDAVEQCPTGTPVHSFAPHFQSTLFANMIAPLLGLRYSAVVWVHGARNTGDDTPYMGARYYACALRALILDWRAKLGQAALPFLVAEMPVYCNSEDFATWHVWCTEKESRLKKPDEHLAEMRVAQLEAEKLAGVYVVSTMDQGSLAHGMGGTIHSVRKPDQGERLALTARAGVYGDKCAIWSGPSALKAWRPRPGWVGICFDVRGGGGLVLNTSMHCPTPVLPVYCTGAGFEVKVGETWMPPFSAMLSRSGVLLEVPAIGVATRVRYAWADWPVTVLTSSAGQPARTFDLPVQGEGSLECPSRRMPEACSSPISGATSATSTSVVAIVRPVTQANATKLDAAGHHSDPASGATAVVFTAAGTAVSTARQIDTEAESHTGLVTASLALNVVGLSVALACCLHRRTQLCTTCKASCHSADSERTVALMKRGDHELVKSCSSTEPPHGICRDYDTDEDLLHSW